MPNRLQQILEDQLGLYRSLYETIGMEKTAIVDLDLEVLNRILMEKKVLLQKIDSIEGERIACIKKIADSLGRPPEGVTLSALIQWFNPPHSTRFQISQAELLSLTEKIHAINKQNKSLLIHCLGVVKGSLALLSGLSEPEKLYYRTGKTDISYNNGNLLSAHA
jgi:flagellar biosynthesis/type III secretory pathway chaperone